MGKPPLPISRKQPASPLTTNQRVVLWARGKLGRKVGEGECWDLAEEALKKSDAYTSNDLGPVGDDTDYVWGDPIEMLKNIKPGDILQLRDHEVIITTVTEITFANGVKTETKIDPARRGHHTAIVNGNPDSNGAVETLEQHVKPLGEVVQNKKLYTRNIGPVVTTTHERRESPFTKKTEMAKVVTTLTIEVTGTIWAYRPKPKRVPQ